MEFDFSTKVKEKARSLGADIVGIAPVCRWVEAPAMLRPQAHLESAKSVVVMGIHHPDASVEWGGLPTSNYAGPFQIGMIPKLDGMSADLAEFLESEGYESIPYPCTGFWRHRPYKDIKTTNTASFSHRHAAVAAGLGEFGWNNLFLSPKYGPRQRLVSVFTSAPLSGDPLYDGPALCDRCMACARECPGKNYGASQLLSPGKDRVVIEGKSWEYAKLNRWRCIWGEQFALDMSRLAEADVRTEDDLYKAVDQGTPRLGGEFGNCFRACMSAPVRIEDTAYSTAPRRKKEKKEADTGDLIRKLEEIGLANGADRMEILPLASFDDEEMSLSSGYPLAAMRKHFSFVILYSRRMPSYPIGHDLLADARAYQMAATKVRLSIASYDAASYLDELGLEAMQDWMSLGDAANRRQKWGDADDLAVVYRFSENEEHPLPLKERYAPAGLDTVGVQREQQSMTAGQQGQTGEDEAARFVSVGIICKARLSSLRKRLHRSDIDLDVGSFSAAPFLSGMDSVGVIKISSIQNIPGIMDPGKALPGAQSLVVLLKGIAPSVADRANEQEADCAASYSYLNYLTLRKGLWAAQDLSDWFQGKGIAALPFADLSLSSYRTVAPYWEFSWAKLGHPDPRANAPVGAAAGLGEIGRSGLLLTPGFGPHVKLVFVAVAADLPETASAIHGLCDDCGKCAESCPVSALDSSKMESAGIPFSGRYTRQETRCRWARSLAMVDAEGPRTIGWEKPELPVPDTLTNEEALAALSLKDPMQKSAYLYPCQIETLAEPCAHVCPAGRKKTRTVGTI